MSSSVSEPSSQLSLPFDIKIVDDKLSRQIHSHFTGESTGYVQVGPDKWFLPIKYRDHANDFFNFKVRPDDIWIVAFPRSGTTWTQQLVWLVANDLDYERASKTPLIQRFPFLEFNILVHDDLKTDLLSRNRGEKQKETFVKNISQPGHKALVDASSPRFIKSHFPFSLLPPSLLHICKVIYLARNPKDVATSFYHLNRLIRVHGYVGDFSTFWDYFEKGLRPWAPYWTHIQEAWDRRHHPNLLFLFYEDMNKDLPATIRQVCQFLDKPISESQVLKLADHLTIANFRKNPTVNFDLEEAVGLLKAGEQCFIRKGKTGGWREEFTAELNTRADKWIEENLKKTDLRFPTM